MRRNSLVFIVDDINGDLLKTSGCISLCVGLGYSDGRTIKSNKNVCIIEHIPSLSIHR